MLIDYTLDVTPPLPPLQKKKKKKKREREREKKKKKKKKKRKKEKRRRRQIFVCFKIPTCTGIALFPAGVAHVITANTPNRFFRLHLGTNFLSFDLDLLPFSFSKLFLFSFLLPSSSDAPFQELTPKLKCEPRFAMNEES